MRVALLIEALHLRASLPVLLRVLPLDRVLRALTPEPRARIEGATSAIEQVTDAVTRRFRPTRTACLKRALMRYALLRRAGYPATFVIGVRPGGGADGFEAHAWVALDGVPIMERAPVDYRATFVWPESAT